MSPSQPTTNGAARAVVFDLDGLLIDTEWAFAEAAGRLLAKRGLTLEPAFFATMMGSPARDALPRFCKHYEIADPLDVLAAEYKEEFTAALSGKLAPVMPGALDLLDQLDQHDIPKAIATSSSRRYVDGVFGPHGLLDRFAFVLTCDDVTRGKPNPEVYQLAAKRFGLPPHAVLVLEDSVNGLKAAKAAGCRCVIVPHRHTPREELHAADLVAPSLAAADLWRLLI